MKLRVPRVDERFVPVVGFAVFAAILNVVQLTVSGAAGLGDGLTGLVSGWRQYDSNWYVIIAEHGYRSVGPTAQEVAWFPGLPLATRALDVVVGSITLSAVLVSLLSGLVATVLLHRLAGRWGLDEGTRRLAVAVWLTYPFAWFLAGAIYADGLFLAFAIGAFLLLEQRRVGAAALAAACATAIRPTGPLLVVALVIRELELTGALTPLAGSGVLARFRLPLRVDRSRFRARTLLLVGGLGGLVAYAAYLAIRSGDPFAFVQVQRTWSQGPGLGWYEVLKRPLLGPIQNMERPDYVLSGVSQGLIVGAVLLSAPFVGRRFGWGAGAYVLMNALLTAIDSKDFEGGGRYMLACFPVALLGAEALARRPRWLQVAWCSTGAVLVVVLCGVWSSGHYFT